MFTHSLYYSFSHLHYKKYIFKLIIDQVKDTNINETIIIFILNSKIIINKHKNILIILPRFCLEIYIIYLNEQFANLFI